MLARKIIAGIMVILFAAAYLAEAQVRDVKAIGEAALKKGIITAPPAGHDFTKIQHGANYKEGQLLVRFEPREIKGKLSAMNTKEKKQILDLLGGAKEKRNFDIVPGLSLVELPAGVTVEEGLKKFNKKDGILYAEPDYEIEVCGIPNDTRFGELWGMHNIGQSGGTEDADIDAPEAWDISTGSSDIIVAIIDTGVDYTHPDLATNMWTDQNGYHGYDFCNNDNDPMDDEGHGTHCAGTIGAIGNNNQGVAGVCWNVKIMALKFLNSEGRGYVSDAINCVTYATLMGANLSSNSWGGGSYSVSLKQAIETSGEAGMLFVAAAGNSGSNNDSNPHYPSSYDCENIIAVMATTRTDAKAYYSCYGPTSVDIGAPGSDILSCKPGNQYQYGSGTSMATPHVAGACALIWSMYPALDNLAVKEILMLNADKILSLDGYCVSEGRLNLYNAVKNVNSEGVVSLDRDFYSCSDTIAITLADGGLVGRGNQHVSIESSVGDVEDCNLDEIYSGIFKGTISTSGDTVEPNDGTIQLSHGDTITVTYDDANDGSGYPAEVNDTAEADCEGPIISDVEYDDIILLPGSQVITFETDEVASVKVRYGTVCGGPNTIEVSNPSFSQQHSITLGGLSPRTRYYFEIEATDLLGNTAINNNGGNCYSFYTYPINIYVPGDFNNIQDAINDSWDGCIIWVAPGVYTGPGNRDIDFMDKAITVQSTNPSNWDIVEATVIDCGGSRNNPHCGFYFHHGEDNNSVIDGLTITNGYGLYIPFDDMYAGGAILCERSSAPTIRRCVLKDNMNDKVHGDTYGGAISCYEESYGGANPLIENCTIYDNDAYYGGGISVVGTSATIRNCMIWGNGADRGGGIDLLWGYSVDVNNCTIVNNSADNGGDGINSYLSTETITNCILWGNGDDLYDCSATYSCIQDGDSGTGNISSDPCFVDANGNNFHLKAASLCVEAGDPNGNYSGQTDIDNSPRLLGQRVDIGADETGRVYNVNTNKAYDTIGDAMAEASSGDEIVATPYIYRESVVVRNGVTLRSTDPNDPCVVKTTIIDGENVRSLVVDLGRDAILSGLTVRNGPGRGVNCYCNNNPTISNCIIEYFGAYGIMHSGCGSSSLPGLTVKNCIIRNNGYGCGIWTDSGASTIEENQIYGNSKGIYASVGSRPTIRNNQVYGNNYGISTGIYIDRGTATIEENLIYGNGFGIRSDRYSTSTIKRNRIYNNNDVGICVLEYSTGTIRNNLIYGNGCGIDITIASMIISNNTVVKNTEYGIKDVFAYATINNCILWNNSYDLYDYGNVTYSCIEQYEESWGGTGNIGGDANDPCFMDADSNNFHLDIRSPCINAGFPDANYNGQTDIDGDARIIGSYADMGADEVIVPISDAHQWGLDEKSGATAYDSVGNSNGTFNGGDPRWVKGFIGGAVDFDGVSDYFSVPSLDNAYSNNSVFTVAGWFKTDQSTGKQTIVGQWSQAWEAGQEYYGWQVLVENSKVAARFGHDVDIYNITGTKTVTDGLWHHFAMVRNGTSVAVYVDGQPKGSGTANFEVYNTKFRIGDGSYTFSYPPTLQGGPFNGIIDDVMIFNRVLSAGEVEQLYEDVL